MTTPTIEVPTAEEIAAAAAVLFEGDDANMEAIIDLIAERSPTDATPEERGAAAAGMLVGLQIAAMRAEDDREDLRAADINDRD